MATMIFNHPTVKHNANTQYLPTVKQNRMVMMMVMMMPMLSSLPPDCEAQWKQLKHPPHCATHADDDDDDDDDDDSGDDGAVLNSRLCGTMKTNVPPDCESQSDDGNNNGDDTDVGHGDDD